MTKKSAVNISENIGHVPDYNKESREARIATTGKLWAMIAKRFKYPVSAIENLEGYLKGRFTDVQRNTCLATIAPTDIASAIAENNQLVQVSKKEVEAATKVVKTQINHILTKQKEYQMETKKKTTKKAAAKKTVTKKVPSKKPAAKPAEPKVAATLPGSYAKPEENEKVGSYTQRLLKSGKFTDDQIILIIRKEFKGSNYTKKEIAWNKWKLKQKK